MDEKWFNLTKGKLVHDHLLQSLTDGDTIFDAIAELYPEVLFMRCRPTLEKSVSFAMDENEPEKMIDAMKKELSGNPKYFEHILDSAAVIASRAVETYSLDHLKMFEGLVTIMEKRRQFPEAIHLAETILDHITKKGIFTTLWCRITVLHAY